MTRKSSQKNHSTPGKAVLKRNEARAWLSPPVQNSSVGLEAPLRSLGKRVDPRADCKMNVSKEFEVKFQRNALEPLPQYEMRREFRKRAWNRW